MIESGAIHGRNQSPSAHNLYARSVQSLHSPAQRLRVQGSVSGAKTAFLRLKPASGRLAR
jgi:hypothetical protein